MSCLHLNQPSLAAQYRLTDPMARVVAALRQQPCRHTCACTCSTSSTFCPAGRRAVPLASHKHAVTSNRNVLNAPSASSQSRYRRPVVQPRASSAAGAVPEPEGQIQKRSSKKAMVLIGLGTAAAIAAGIALYVSGHASTLQSYLMNGPLGRNGMLAAFCLIFLSELGDKTFFIAALLAMKLGRWISFAGSLAALAVMTLISVGIGAAFSKVPDALKSSLPVGEIAGVALLVFFGIKALKAAKDADTSGTSTSEEELADAEVAVEEFTSSKKLSRKQHFANMFEVATLIFLAEWGDRSMLATIALGAAQNPVGVAVGATAGHALATAIAVAGGALAGKYVDEKTVNIVSGCLFLLFAAATVYTML